MFVLLFWYSQQMFESNILDSEIAAVNKYSLTVDVNAVQFLGISIRSSTAGSASMLLAFEA